jgi:hypothetical protein
MVAIKGHFDGKVFVPDEPVDLPRGQAVVLHVQRAPASADRANGQTLLDALSPFIGSVSMPPDWSVEHDHYLYGSPKRNQTGNGKE